MKSDSQQRRKIQTLEFLNSVLTDLINNGFNLNPYAIQSINKKKNINIQDIEQLAQLSVDQGAQIARSHQKQDKGEYQKVNYEHITLQKYKNMNSLTMASQRSDNISSSSYDKKLQTMTRGVKIVVKVKRK